MLVAIIGIAVLVWWHRKKQREMFAGDDVMSETELADRAVHGLKETEELKRLTVEEAFAALNLELYL